MHEIERFAVVSDIHGNVDALEAVFAELDREDCSMVFNCGDTLGGPLASRRTADLLQERNVPMIAGNHERQLLTLPAERLGPSDACTASEITPAQRVWLSTAPPTMWLAPDVFACHGTPTSDVEYWLETVTPGFGASSPTGLRPATTDEIRTRLGDRAPADRASLIVCGHTHIPRVVELVTDRRTTIVNPGSVGLPAYDDTHPHPHVVDNGSPHARYAVATRALTGWSVQLRTVAYDFEPMARLAEQRHRPDWAHALRTGRALAPN